MRNACDSDSRCGLACDASARDAKSLALRVERCEPLSSELSLFQGLCTRGDTERVDGRGSNSLRSSTGVLRTLPLLKKPPPSEEAAHLLQRLFSRTLPLFLRASIHLPDSHRVSLICIRSYLLGGRLGYLQFLLLGRGEGGVSNKGGGIGSAFH